MYDLKSIKIHFLIQFEKCSYFGEEGNFGNTIITVLQLHWFSLGDSFDHETVLKENWKFSRTIWRAIERNFWLDRGILNIHLAWFHHFLHVYIAIAKTLQDIEVIEAIGTVAADTTKFLNEEKAAPKQFISTRRLLFVDI